MLKNTPVSTYFLGQKLDNIIQVFFSVIDIHKVVPHATLVHIDLIVYKRMLI